MAHPLTASGTKLVFLDCDGVVSPFGVPSASFFSPVHMARLKRILDATGAKIVLSSSWRATEFGRAEVTKQLVANGMPSFIACTPDIPNRSRAWEIMLWVEENKDKLQIVNFVALDDIHLSVLAPNRLFFEKHAIHTNGSAGLTDKDVEKAIALLDDSNNF